MSKKTRMLTLSAMMTALAVTMLYIASLWPTGQVGLTAIASLFVAAALIESGITSAISVFITSSVLALLIVPNRITPLLFVIFLGYYPIIKSIIEKRWHIIFQILFKLLIFNIALFVFWYFISQLLFAFIDMDIHTVFIFIGGSFVFLLYDYGFTKLIWFYINRISISRSKNK
jgi:hypothetical protein